MSKFWRVASLPQRLKEWSAFLLLGCLSWGAAFLWIKIGLSEIGPVTLVMYRLIFATIVSWLAIAIFRFPLPSTRRIWLSMIFVGIINISLPLILISWGETKIGSGLTGILNGTVPIITIIMESFFLHEYRLTTLKIVGVLLGFFGTAVIISADLGAIAIPGSLLGQIAVTTAAALYACSSIFIRSKLKDQPPILISAVSLSSALFVVMIITLLTEGRPCIPVQPITWIAIIWLGIIGTAIAYPLYFYLIGMWGPTRATLVTYIYPIIALVLGVIFLDEELNWQFATGGGLIVGGIIVANRNTSSGHGE